MLRKIILSVFATLFLISCGITKKTSRTDKSEGTKSVEERILTRPGDTITIDIPNIRYKDTVIERVNYDTKTIARVVYDDQGNQRFDCIPAEIKEEFRLMREEFKNDIDDEKESKHEFNPQHFIYALAVLVGVIIIALIVGMVAIKRIQKTIPGIVANSIDKLKE